MDSIFAISFGLGLRFVVDAVSDHDFKITGTIVGLWEGVIMLHFTKKMPKSSDPFIAYAVRLFVDFLYTESVTRLVLVLVWTALGMVLADVTPAIWYEVGLRRIWRRFRRDIYTISRMIPTVAFFPPTRTVRFSPSREPSTIMDADADADAVPPPSVITTDQTPTTNTVPTTTAPATRDILRRRVPGYFPADFSDTETELGSVRAGPSPRERTSRRLSVFPIVHDFDESVSSQNDLDEGNLSSVSSTSTERPGASSTFIDASTIPDMLAEEALVDVVAAPVKDEEEVKTPKQSAAPYMPPTPSDSAMYLYRHPPSEDPLVVRPPSEFMPQIPDFLDEGNTEDWEKIQIQEATEGKPPTPPAKDPAYQLKVPIIPVPVPPQPQLQRSTPSPEDEAKEWDMLDLQFISNPNDNPNATSNDHQGQTYVDDDDDMYGEEAPDYRTFPAMGESSRAALPPLHTTDFTSGILEPVRMDPWATLEEKKRMDEEVERQRRENEEAARKQQEEEDSLKEKQEEEARQLEEQRLKEKEAQEKKAQEKAERLKKEAEDDAIRKKKREEEEVAERKRKEEEGEAAERKRKEEEEAAERQRKEEAEERRKREEAEAEEQRKQEAKAEELRKQEDERQKKEEEKQRKQEEKQRRKEEAEQKQKEEAERKRVEEEEKENEKAKKLADAAEARRLKEEAAEKKRLEEEAEAFAVAAAVAQATAEEEERKKEEEAEAQRAAIITAEEDARLKSEKEKQIKEQEEASQKQAEEKGQTEAAQTEPVPPNDAEQGAEKTLPPSPTQLIEPEADAETVMSAVSDPPSNDPSHRLDKMLLLRAQMVQMEGRLKDLISTDADQEIKQTEKILRKMRRQAEKRYAAGEFMFLTIIYF